jgi:hypothetical protein
LRASRRRRPLKSSQRWHYNHYKHDHDDHRAEASTNGGADHARKVAKGRAASHIEFIGIDRDLQLDDAPDQVSNGENRDQGCRRARSAKIIKRATIRVAQSHDVTYRTPKLTTGALYKRNANR